MGDDHRVDFLTSHCTGDGNAHTVKGVTIQILTGGGAHLRGLDKLITAETGMPVNIANEPLNCVALGTGMVLDQIDTLKSVLISPRKALF